VAETLLADGPNAAPTTPAPPLTQTNQEDTR